MILFFFFVVEILKLYILFVVVLVMFSVDSVVLGVELGFFMMIFGKEIFDLRYFIFFELWVVIFKVNLILKFFLIMLLLYFIIIVVIFEGDGLINVLFFLFVIVIKLLFDVLLVFYLG